MILYVHWFWNPNHWVWSIKKQPPFMADLIHEWDLGPLSILIRKSEEEK